MWDSVTLTNLNNDQTTHDEVKYPNFDVIVKLTKATIKENFEKYGDSWQEMSYTGLLNSKKDWWNNRLQVEVNELINSRDDGQRREELLDIIAVASFMLETLHKHGDFIWNDPNWRYG